MWSDNPVAYNRAKNRIRVRANRNKSVSSTQCCKFLDYVGASRNSSVN
jgi:hypothetical protein